MIERREASATDTEVEADWRVTDLGPLRPYVVDALATNVSNEVTMKHAWLAVDWIIRTYAPVWLKLANVNVDELVAMSQITPANIAATVPILAAARQKVSTSYIAARNALAAKKSLVKVYDIIGKKIVRNRGWNAAWYFAKELYSDYFGTESKLARDACWRSTEIAAWVSQWAKITPAAKQLDNTVLYLEESATRLLIGIVAND